jgi:hypothetical protein
MAEILDFRKRPEHPPAGYRPTAPYVVGYGRDENTVALCLTGAWIDLSLDEARRLAAQLVRYANAVEDGQGELDLGEGDEPDEAV